MFNQNKKSKRGRKPISSAVLTDPEKLEEMRARKEKREATKRKKKQKSAKTSPQKRQANKKKDGAAM